jgi:hypothetical protein
VYASRRVAHGHRCCMCRLLQRQCVASALGVPFAEVKIQRTRGRKPFYAGQAHDTRAPNFNFNASHEVPQSATRGLRPALARAYGEGPPLIACHSHREAYSQTDTVVPTTTGGLRGVGGRASVHLRRGCGSTAAGQALAAGATGCFLRPLRAAVYPCRGGIFRMCTTQATPLALMFLPCCSGHKRKNPFMCPKVMHPLQRCAVAGHQGSWPR